MPQTLLVSCWWRKKLSLLFPIRKPPWIQNTHKTEHQFLLTSAYSADDHTIKADGEVIFVYHIDNGTEDWVSPAMWISKSGQGQPFYASQWKQEQLQEMKEKGKRSCELPAAGDKWTPARVWWPRRPRQSTAESLHMLCPRWGMASLGDQLCSSSPSAWWPIVEAAGI